MAAANITYEHVYYVEANQYTNPIAIRPKIRNKRIEWEDTSTWGTSFRIVSIRTVPPESLDPSHPTPPQSIEITTEEGFVIVLKELTVPIYNEKLKEWVAGSPEFKNDEELQHYYLTTDFGAY